MTAETRVKEKGYFRGLRRLSSKFLALTVKHWRNENEGRGCLLINVQDNEIEGQRIVKFMDLLSPLAWALPLRDLKDGSG